MNKIILLSTWLFISSLHPSAIERKFPDFQQTTLDGIGINQEKLKGKDSFVAIGFLGCGAHMFLLKDLETFADSLDTTHQQIVVFLENTPDQVEAFFQEEKNMWSDFRKQYKIKSAPYLIVPDCEEETLETKDGITYVGRQCRKLSKKLRTKSSPTFYHVNAEGRIVQSSKGYWALLPKQERLKKLNDFLAGIPGGSAP
ncbi:MAG: hypothetical protein AAGI38_15070 [Bacteroidota bacterium]